MIRLIQQIFIEHLLSATHNRDWQILLIKEWLKWGNKISNHLGWCEPNCALQSNGKEGPGSWGQAYNQNIVAPILPTDSWGAAFWKKNLMFIFERDRQTVSRGGAERGGDTEFQVGSSLWANSREPDAGLKPTNHEIMMFDDHKIGCLTNWAIQVPWGLQLFRVSFLPPLAQAKTLHVLEEIQILPWHFTNQPLVSMTSLLNWNLNFISLSLYFWVATVGS